MNENQSADNAHKPDENVADRNIERLLSEAYQPEIPDPEFVARATSAMQAAAGDVSERPPSARRSSPSWRLVRWAVAATLLIGVGAVLGRIWLAKPDDQREGRIVRIGAKPHELPSREVEPEHVVQGNEEARQSLGGAGLTARARQEALPPMLLGVGESLSTGIGERGRVELADGSIVYLNESTSITLTERRRLSLESGEVFVEVQPVRVEDDDEPNELERFVVVTPDREVTALGTKFDARVSKEGTSVFVTQGKVAVTGLDLPLLAGQQLGLTATGDEPTVVPSPRATHLLDWTRELLAKAESPLVPESNYSGGALIAVDPNGQEARLSLRKYHVDVHIQDGFARTTIDQTYFNHETRRLEGTFYFPLPPDASLSRLAMYVNGKLMEGGMAERNHARQVFETIVNTQKDPALLEWIDGSTFKMRVFPLEGRQEKRIILSYTQRLASLYGRSQYRFPGGHSMQTVRDWSARVLVHGGARLRCESDSHDFKRVNQDGHLVLTTEAANCTPNQDIILKLRDRKEDRSASSGSKPASRSATAQKAEIATTVHEDFRYLMLRWQPELPGKQSGERRDWIFLFESSADRNPLLARVQIDVIETLLENAEHEDTFTILTAGTHVAAYQAKAVPAKPKNVRQAIAYLEQVHLVGALDLAQAFEATEPYVQAAQNPVLVHIGSATPVLGERDVAALVRKVPQPARYVGVGVGKRWSRNLMKTAAARTGGYFTQINPDEQVAWRTFDLLSTLNTPRLLDLRVSGDGDQLDFLCYEDSLAQGEQLCAIVRCDADRTLPESLEVSGTLDGKRQQFTIPIGNPVEGADYLPRTWAKLEIDRLVALGSQEHRDQIVALSKAMYVMSPFTSLLVLENDQMYEQYNVDRGRKDHWALYDCPEQIPVVHEPLPDWRGSGDAKEKPNVRQVLQTILVSRPSQARGWPEHLVPIDWLSFADINGNEAGIINWNTVTNGTIWQHHFDGDMPLFDGTPFTTTWTERFGGHFATMERLREVRHRNFALALLDIDHSLMEFPAHPEPHVWADLTHNRMRHASIDLSRPSRAEAKILDALAADTELEFTNAPLDAVIEHLKETHDIDMEINTRALDDVGVATDEPITLNLSQKISLRSALMLLVEPLRLTYVVRDDELLITTPEDAENRFKVYPVGDLVLPTDSMTYLMGGQGGFRGGGFGLHRPLPLGWSRVPMDWGRPMITTFPEGAKFTSSAVISADRRYMRVTPMPMFSGMGEVTTFAFDGSSRFGSWGRHYAGGHFTIDYLGWLPEIPMAHPVSESAVLKALRSPTRLDFVDAPLLDVIDYLKEQHDLDIQIDASLLADKDFADASIQTIQLEDISLWGALRHILRPLQLTFVVRGNVLLITTPDEARSCVAAEYRPAAVLRRLKKGLAPTLTYGQPEIEADWSDNFDLLKYAPAMDTTLADVLAVLEAEAKPDPNAAPGKIDEEASELIEKSRGRGWQTATKTDSEGKPLFSIDFDGTGRYRYERKTGGLRELAMCDGNNVWHLYPELGVGARRESSRFHRRYLGALIPWALPPAEDLARGADLKALDDKSVVIVPHGIPRLKSRDGQPPEHVRMLLIFASDGRLAERRLVRMPGDETLARQTYAADGTTRWLDSEDRLLCERKVKLKPCGAPALKPDTTDLVILPMPVRLLHRGQWASALLTPGQANSWTEDDTSQALSAVLRLNTSLAQQIIAQRIAGGDTRLGLYTLLITTGCKWDPKKPHNFGGGYNTQLDPLEDQPDHPLAKYIAAYLKLRYESGQGQFGTIGGPADGFLQQLAEFRDLWALYSGDQKEKADRQAQNRKRLLDFVRRCDVPHLGFALLLAARDERQVDEFYREVGEAFKQFRNVPELAYVARYEHARSMHKSGDWKLAQRLFAQLHADTLETGVLPPIDADFHKAFAYNSRQGDWRKLMRLAAEKQIEQKNGPDAAYLAWQAEHVGDAELGEELFRLATDSIRGGKHWPTRLAAAECLWHSKRKERAGAMLWPLLDEKRCRQSKAMWQLAARVAEQQGMTARALECMQQMLLRKYETLSGEFNVKVVRNDYGTLLQQYEQLAKSIVTLDSEPSDGLLARVIQAADRWRAIDPDPTTACQTAARIFGDLGASELAWDYLTTPLAARPNEAAPWVSMAQMLRKQGHLELADRAYASAFEAEATNAQILWDRAQVLLEAGRKEDAKRLMQQVVDGEWPRQFNRIQTQAKQYVEAN